MGKAWNMIKRTQPISSGNPDEYIIHNIRTWIVIPDPRLLTKFFKGKINLQQYKGKWR